MLPFVFDVKRVEEPKTSMLIKKCEKRRHIPLGKGVISGRLGKVVVHETCIVCGSSYERAPNLEEIQLYEKTTRNPYSNYKNSIFV